MLMITESVWAISEHVASCLRMELTLFAVVLISCYIFIGCISKVMEPVRADPKAEKSVTAKGRQTPKLRKSKNAIAMVAKSTSAHANGSGATHAILFVEDLIRSYPTQRLGISLDLEQWNADDVSTAASGSATPSSEGRSSDDELLGDGDDEVQVGTWTAIGQRFAQVFSDEVNSQDEDFFSQVDRQTAVQSPTGQEDEGERSSMASWCSLSQRFANILSEAEDDDNERSSLDPWRAVSQRFATHFSYAEDSEEDN
jgi:hypothetical protein